MSTTRESSTRTAVRRAVAATSVALWLVGSTLNPVAAISEGSSLAWRAEPATASVGQLITSVVGDPTGPKVKVVMYNGSGVQERIAGIPIVLRFVERPQCLVEWNGTELTDADGVATFKPIANLMNREGLDCQLQAFADDRASLNSGHIAETPLSDPFDVRQGDVTGCTGTCGDDIDRGGTQVQVTANVTGYLVLDLGEGQLTCGGYTTSSGLATFDVVGNELGRTTVTITLDQSQVTRSFKKYEVCLEKSSSDVRQLPDCPKKVTPDTDSCVVSRTREKDRDVRVTISVKPGDPRVGL